MSYGFKSGPIQFNLPGGPEMLIFVLVLLFFVVLAFGLAYWEYNDATKHGDDNAALWALAAGGLTMMSFFGGLLAVAVYVWQREPGSSWREQPGDRTPPRR